ncbi:cyclopropane-fatty-acyl-phospholipid synthase family protein [Roseobacter sp. YSTF-M11]|uniref:Cyclopropane-fatty-acyl-phospholipid synthase family protein n=1 Tax=Roseobacter insulae TaxID=2859783 RepID=A0A9X1JWI7_9RHOB|nr:cyclopropane-fatty-acyl-phospholipid synthase family protein [Roseobacter insulae]MBW4706200.1 cyclopropane-fatty-acyl-phospholipid synthase family protein [Roseobacter insulae]
MWQKALDRMLQVMLHSGAIIVIMPDGSTHSYGDGTGVPVAVRLHDMATVRHLVLNPELALGEAYMNGTLTIEEDRLQELLGLVVRNLRSAPRVFWQRPLLKLRVALRRFTQRNAATRARRHVAHHYDLSDRLYGLFLDEDRQYSCGYFRTPDDTLAQSQAQKKDHIARKLLIRPGMKVLDVGCGWGGMALTLAQDHGAEVLGITLSREQLAVATQRAARAGLSDQVRFRLCDYRGVDGTFDRIVSVGMFEHVGLPHYNSYFRTVRDRLADDGIALVHTIGWVAPPDATNPWIAKYIFPGGYIPTLSEISRAVETAMLWPADIECWRLHYAYTLRHWFDRFNDNEADVRALYDARFVRMWRFYLAACEQTFRHGRQAVYQLQLSRRVDAVPLTRDYLYRDAPLGQMRRAAE